MPKSKFQKGCINFVKAEGMSLNVVEDLIVDCSTVNLVAIREKYLAEKKSKAKVK